MKWTRDSGTGAGSPGVLTTAWRSLFTGDVSGNLLALDPAKGDVLWHSYGGGNLTTCP